MVSLGFPGGSVAEILPAHAGDEGSVPGSGRSPGKGDDSTPQCSCLENPMDRGAWRDMAQGAAKE